MDPNLSPTKKHMIEHAMSKVGPPKGREGGIEGYSLGQAQELTMHSLDFLCVAIDMLLDGQSQLERRLVKNQRDRPM